MKPMTHPLEPRRHLAVDLTATAALADDDGGVYGPGDAVEVDLTVTNRGSTATPVPFNVLLVLTTDGQLGDADDVRLGVVGVTGGLAAGQTRTFDARRLTLPADFDGGDGYRLAVVADDNGFNNGGAVAESNESNNAVVYGGRDDPAVTLVADALPAGFLTGTNGADRIAVRENSANGIVTLNGTPRYFAKAGRPRLQIDGGGGNDRVSVDGDVGTIRLQVTGSGGNDTIVGGGADDELSGANGKDKVDGGDGEDYLLGGAQNDRLNGNAGDDTLSGAGGNDALTGDRGRDDLFGGNGNDSFESRDVGDPSSRDEPDSVSGGAGRDRARVDEDDDRTSIEELLG